MGVVMKFGGTSVADPDAIARLIGIVRHQRERSDASTPPVVVVSALAGVTDNWWRWREWPKTATRIERQPRCRRCSNGMSASPRR